MPVLGLGGNIENKGLDQFARAVYRSSQTRIHLFSALQHPRNFSVQFGTVRFVNRPF
jgi:hypothetical protein